MGAAAAWDARNAVLQGATISATKAVAQVATAFDCSSRDAVEHINAVVRSGRLAMFGCELLDDGTRRIWQIEEKELQGARLHIDGEGRVRLLGVAGTGVVGVAWCKAQILFRQEDIDGLWPLPKPIHKRRPTDAQLRAAVLRIDKKHPEGAHPGEDALWIELKEELPHCTVTRDDVRAAFKGHRLWGSRGQRSTKSRS